ncbi:2520_t:CDS:10 [Diversispora eburnea]|uniref:2520_t:CDS:1 n=1 Tax=Diversispora eburnea TaxID=1213867 RepID=A0A9N8VLA2_9GLOM|nr:2520_t:CDS:10 [Diversispora eburnea]
MSTVGSGGREHAIAWKLAQSSRVERIYVAPGNGGTETEMHKVCNVNIGVSDFEKLTQFALKNNVNLVVPGPEQPLVEGIEMAFKKIGIPCFGPSPKASIMEGSKTFAKNFMKRHNIPTAAYENFSDYEQAKDYLNSVSYNVVIKASGLAGGKGVLIPTNKEEAFNALKEIMVDQVFGSAGQELSILTFSDGYTIVNLPPAQDHKRAFDGDQGPNTGGMGCYCPTPIITPELNDRIKNMILQPTIDGMRHEGFPFVGMLFTGLMITDSGPKVLEYNVRFGDPETEVVLPLLSEDTDLAEIMLACAERRLDSVKIKIKQCYAATVVITSGGYPKNYLKGKEISIADIPSDGKVVTSGGRVLSITGVGNTLKEAVKKAYDGVKAIQFEKMFYRKDIAHRTQRSGSNCEIGGFGGLFDLKAAGFNDPILVSTTDGVGTKLKISQAMNIHNTIGAEPLFFLDYYACSKLNVDVTKNVIEGIVKGCIISGCALIGGETAEMPGIYNEGEYDLAGFAVGAVERGKLLPQSLLTPTKIYVNQLKPLIKKGLVKSMAHITGGGFIDNIPRAIPEHLSVIIDSKSWEIPHVFKWLARNGNVPSDELFRTFNCGIGMVLIISPEDINEVFKILKESDNVYKIGQVVTKESNNGKEIIIEGINEILIYD